MRNNDNYVKERVIQDLKEAEDILLKDYNRQPPNMNIIEVAKMLQKERHYQMQREALEKLKQGIKKMEGGQ
jgi:hypothetical protein